MSEEQVRQEQEQEQGYEFRLGQHVFAQLDRDDGDLEWIHSVVLGRTGNESKPTYTLENYERTRVVPLVPQAWIRRMS